MHTSTLRLGASRLPDVGTTIFTVMSQLAAQHGAINLGQGFPDFNCDERLRQLLTEAMAQGHNQYAPMTGLPALRQAVAKQQEQVYGKTWDAESEITITAGATEALMAAVLALVHPGDEVIVFEPVYDSYAAAVTLAGGRVVPVPLDATQGFAPDWDRVRTAVTSHTRMLILNFPHNPTGRTLRESDLRALEQLVAATGILVLSDEVYEHIVFDGQVHQSLARSPLLDAHGVVISSFGKTFHTTGWKVGFVCASAAISAEIRKVHQFMVFAVNTPAQHALASYLSDPKPWQTLAQFYQRKRDFFVKGLRDSKLRLLPCEGTYFVLADYSAVSDEPEAAFAQRLITEFGVAAIPLSAFYSAPKESRLVRFCFAKQDETLKTGIERLGWLGLR